MSVHNFRTRKEQIEAQALAARRAGQYVDIDFMLPSILIRRSANDMLRYTEREAQALLDQFNWTAKELGVALKDLLLVTAQEW